MMVNIAVYGTLRQGGWNNRRKAIREPLYTEKLPGYKLGVTFLPFVEKTDNKEDKVIFEFYRIDDSDYRSIEAMELGAGYTTEVMEYKGEEWTWWSHEIPINAKIMEDYINEI
jgi:gamma-glutamylcyclotransferase (GGCT)/AIG2-like uncharacterized protein YtfP